MPYGRIAWTTDEIPGSRMVTIRRGRTSRSLRPDEGAPKPFPLGIEPGGPAALELKRQRLQDDVAQLSTRVAELEHENRGLRRAAAAARAEGERAERERTVRTMGGRLPSILTGGRR